MIRMEGCRAISLYVGLLVDHHRNDDIVPLFKELQKILVEGSQNLFFLQTLKCPAAVDDLATVEDQRLIRIVRKVLLLQSLKSRVKPRSVVFLLNNASHQPKVSLGRIIKT